MKNPFQNLRKINNKPLLFGIYGALGCFLMALLLGELLFYLLTPALIETPEQAIVLLIDTSGSMDAGKLAEVKNAATNFVDRQDLNTREIAVVGFGSNVQIGTPLTNELPSLRTAIQDLSDGGGTRMDNAIEAATAQLAGSSRQQSILLFTDGQPGFQGADLVEEANKAIATAQKAKSKKIHGIAVATGDANTDFLAELTQNPDLVFFADSGNFEQAFQSAEKAMNSLIGQETSNGGHSILQSFGLTSAWTGLIAVGASLALIIGQNHFLRRRLITPKETLLGIGGGLLAGLLAGAIAQLGYAIISQLPPLAIVGRVLGWSVMGTLVGGGMSLLVPNLKWDKALLGGVLGGTIGGLAFLISINFLGDTVGRLLGASSLGFSLGVMIALLEEMSRKSWLLIHWSPKEKTTLSLGSKPIILGSSPDAHVYLRKDMGYPATTGKIYQEGDKVYLEFDPHYAQQKSMKKIKQELKNGDNRKFDRLSLEIKISPTNLTSIER